MMDSRSGNGSNPEKRKASKVRVSCECGDITIRLRRSRIGRPPPLSGLDSPMSDAPYLFFSPLEEAVVRLLCGQGPMTCEEIAKELSESPTGKLKYLLANLAQRQVLSSSNGGYNVNAPAGHDRHEFCDSLLAALDNRHSREGAADSG